jgi:phospholipase C
MDYSTAHLQDAFSDQHRKKGDPMPNSLDKIENFVVLVMENRSFDHMLGFLKRDGYAVDGLSGNERIPADPAAAGSSDVQISDGANYRGDFNLDPADKKTFIDPNHEVPSVHEQLFRGSLTGDPTNQGFVYDYRQQPNNTDQHAKNIVNCFSPDKLPVVTTLVQQFAVCDHWHSSMPGPTWPNRLFLHAASSGGHIDNNLHEADYNIDTIYDRLEAADRSWRIYFHDMPQSIALTHLQNDFMIKRRFKLFDDFLDAARVGLLPAYSFIEPRYSDFLTLKANDQHPPHDVALGEHLIADVYEAVRNSPQWEQTLLVITWDEHGGTYDHVTPPVTVDPDPFASARVNSGFKFDRLGVRVPMILVSPYINAGGIDSQTYDHTSLLATVEKRFNLPALTARDAQANTFEDILELESARQDCPTVLQRPLDVTTLEAYQASRDIAASLSQAAVKKALTDGRFAQNSASDFQISLVKLAKNLEVKDAANVSELLRLSRWADIEHDAAVQVNDFATKYFKHLF